MKNLSKLESPVFEEIRIEQGTIDEVEDKLIREHSGQHQLEPYSVEEQRALIRNLISALDAEKKEGETVPVFVERMMKDVGIVLEK